MNPELHLDQLYISFASAAFRQEESSLTTQVFLFSFFLSVEKAVCSNAILLGVNCGCESEASRLVERT